MTRVFLSIQVMVFCAFSLSAQNLVPNGDFEDYSELPGASGEWYEYLIPQLDKTTSLYYIYDSDRPGVGGSFYNPKAKIYSLTANFVESLEITHDANGETITDPKTQNWYHRLYIYIDNTGQGGRRLDPNKSVIAAGAGSLEQPTD